MKHPKNKFHIQTMNNPQVIMSKKVNLSLGQIYLAAQFFFTNTLFKLQQQILICFCNFWGNSVIILGLLRFPI